VHVQIYIIELQLLQGFLKGCLDVVVILPVELCDYIKLLALDAALLDG
jgi:hypothetical protein